MINHSPLQILGSRILAAALSECLPGCLFEDAGVVYNGFYCDFFFSGPVSSEILNILEERIRQMIREKRSIRMMEMIPFCASEFLKKHGQNRRAVQVLDQEQYVSLVQIESFADWCERLPFRHTGEAGAVRLVGQIELGKGRLRIIGAADVSKDALKMRLKLYRQFPGRDHERRGAELGFWEIIDGERIWLAQGLEERRRLIGMWRKNFSPIALEVEGDERTYPLISEKRQKTALMHINRIAQPSNSMRGLLDESPALALQIRSFEDAGRDCISFLQTVHKSLTILGFTFRTRFWGTKRKKGFIERSLEHLGWSAEERSDNGEPKLEFLVQDALQCEWVVADVCEPRQKNGLSATVWIERNLALLLEMNDKLRIDDIFPHEEECSCRH